MKKANILKTGFLSAVMLFAANDSNGQSNALAFNDASKAKIETVKNNTPVLEEGTTGEARTVSMKNNSLVLHVSGGTQDKYNAEQYAKMFQIMFKDSNRTDFPTDISVIYEESDDDLPTGIYAFINGRTFDKNGGIYVSGDGVFTAPEIVKWIPEITKQHAAANGIASIKQSGSAPSVAMN